MRELIFFDKLSRPYYFRYRRKPSVQSPSHAISSHPILWTRLLFNILVHNFSGPQVACFIFLLLLCIYYNIYISGMWWSGFRNRQKQWVHICVPCDKAWTRYNSKSIVYNGWSESLGNLILTWSESTLTAIYLSKTVNDIYCGWYGEVLILPEREYGHRKNIGETI